MSDLPKNDILNYEDALLRLLAQNKPRRPQYQIDADFLMNDIWDGPTPEPERGQKLLEAFGSRVQMALHMKCTLKHIQRWLAGELPPSIDWESDDTANAFYFAWVCYRLLSVLSNEAYCNAERSHRFRVPSEQFPEFLYWLQKFRETPSTWDYSLVQILTQICVLLDNDY